MLAAVVVAVAVAMNKNWIGLEKQKMPGDSDDGAQWQRRTSG